MFKMKFGDSRFITVHPNGKNHKGIPVLIDDQGKVVGGMGGTHNGEKIDRLQGKKSEDKKVKKANARDGVFTICVHGMHFTATAKGGQE